MSIYRLGNVLVTVIMYKMTISLSWVMSSLKRFPFNTTSMNENKLNWNWGCAASYISLFLIMAASSRLGKTSLPDWEDRLCQPQDVSQFIYVFPDMTVRFIACAVCFITTCFSLSPVSTTRVDGPCWRPVNSASGNAPPCWRVMETGHP